MSDKKREAARRRRAEAKKAFKALMSCYPLTTDDLDGEQWLPVPYCADYHCSNFGRIKSFKNGRLRIMKPFIQGDYLYIELCKDGVQKTFLIHRLVAEGFISNVEDKPEVNHINGHKFNNFVGNLEWTTHTENIRHASDNGLEKVKRGEDHSQAKLTNDQARYIRDNPDNLTGVELAKKFGVSPQLICGIQLGVNRKQAGGNVRESKIKRTPDNVREAIRAEYKRGVKGCGLQALGNKYGLSVSVVSDIIRTGNRQ